MMGTPVNHRRDVVYQKNHYPGEKTSVRKLVFP